MGENDLDVRTECCYLSYRQDCDGDYDAYCTYSESCPYKKNAGRIIAQNL